MEIPWGKILKAAIVGGIEFVNALDENVDGSEIAKRAIAYVAKNQAAKKKAESEEDDVFSSVKEEGEG